MSTAMASHGHQHLQLEMASQAELESRDNNRENGGSFLGGWIHQPNGTKMAVSVNKKEEEEKGVKQPGGWKSMPYIIGNEACEKLATIGLLSNIVVYLTSKFNMPNVEASFVINVWSGTTNMSPLLGAFLSDSYIGRYWTIALGCIASLIGMILLTLTAIFPSFRPPPCNNIGKELCVGASLGQKALLYSSFAMMTIGAGGIRPCSIAFGADQFDYTSENGKRSIQSFFNWYYFSFTVAVMISLTIIVYIQDSISWSWGMGIPSALMFFSVICFFLGKRLYVLVSPEGSSFTSFAQVIVCAIKKRHLRLPSEQSQAEDFYDPPIKGDLKSRMVLTDQFMFLNKAALKTEQDLNSDGSVVDPWRLCSLQQVEELKSVIRIAPIWLSGINIHVCLAQLNTFSVLQALTMDRHLGEKFQVPAGSFGIFTMLVVTLFLPFYDRVMVPFTRRISKDGNGITLLQRIGVGLCISILSMALAAVFETKRRNVALNHGFMDKPKAVIPMSAFFLVPQYSVAGLAEAFSAIGLIEFLYSQFPENMRSVAGALFFLSIGMGSYVSSFLVGIVHKNTGGRHGKNWLGQNLNKARLDYFYWLLAGLAVINLLYFLFCAQWYRYKAVFPNETKTTIENTIRNSKKVTTSVKE
ncbi:protein NRT1/ PTR FAMILY 2.13 [Cryptomeria japonica]|uniref:protein NRT1/ PTR FAMILY 2.13 n=1 Tax=Cryptomeria japonica TaxID=3369 RepID=UPI0027DAB025|nr:protein NRT1/ PTR FAMILY 2.13 [Cryptomeria japonica]